VFLVVWNLPVRRSVGTLEIINKQPTTPTRPFGFQRRLEGPINGFTKSKAALDEEMERLAGYRIPHWVLHDLRRTGKTLMIRAGVSPHVSERVLGHAISGVEGVYDQHDYLAEKSAAIRKLATLIARILKPNDNVVAIKPPRGQRAAGRGQPKAALQRP
jgi:integrase